MDDYVVPIGGPMDGQWFTRQHWADRLAASRTMVALGQPPSSCLSYVQTREETDNRYVRDDSTRQPLRGTIWRYEPPPLPPTPDPS